MDISFRYGFLYITVNSLYTRILSRITHSESDITCIHYTVDNKEKIIAFDNYSKERIDCIKSFEDLYSCGSFRKMISSSPNTDNNDRAKAIISEIIVNATENRAMNNLYELLISFDNYRCYGDILTNKVLENTEIVSSSIVDLSDNTEDNVDINIYYDNKLTMLFEIFPMVLRENNQLLTSLFVINEYNIADFDESFPNTRLMDIVSSSINGNISSIQTPKIYKGIEKIKTSMKEVTNTINTWKSNIVTDQICRISIDQLLTYINDICNVLGMNNISFDIDIGEYVCVMNKGTNNNVGINGGKLLLVPNMSPDLSTLSTSTLRDLIIYIRDTNCSMAITLENKVMRELARRRIN